MALKNINLNKYLLIIIFILTYLIIPKNCDKGKESDNEVVYNYQTDTIIKKSEFKNLGNIRIADLKKTQPITIIKWLKPKIEKSDSIKIKDSIIIVYKDTSKVKYDKAFLSSYTEANKLINIRLIKDSLSVTTFNKSAELVTQRYPLYLENFGYLYYDNELQRYDLKTKPKEVVKKDNSKFKQLYISTGYSITKESPLLGLDYTIILNRFRFYIESDMSLIQNPELNLNAKIGYRLLK